MRLFQLLSAFQEENRRQSPVVHIEELPPRAPRYARLKRPLNRSVAQALSKNGIKRFYTHQARTIDLVREHTNVVVVTSTASGKTLCYVAPILDKLCSDPGTRALLLYPTKALAQDQLRTLQKFMKAGKGLSFLAGTYDGDTPTDHRRKLRDNAQFILTNPDMLHCAILPNHERWAGFFSNLHFVVIDEVHTYRGIFGSHVSNVIRRLLRICRHYGADPVFICSSATIANPKEHAERIAHRNFILVDNDGSPSGPKRFVLWNPPFVDEDLALRRSANTDATRIMAELVSERIQTITFTRTRLSSELVFRYVQEELSQHSPRLAKAVHAYRGGYLPEERREIERRLAEGSLLGVASTNALELGIDIGSLDACIIVGYPGTIASTWQQAGRAGRGAEEAAVFLVANNGPIDQYIMHHPEYLFGRNPEHAVIDPDNPHIAVGHIRCALAELPLSPGEQDLFGPHTLAMLQILEENDLARRTGNMWRIRGDDYPAGQVELRTATDTVYTIQDTTDRNRVIGTIDELSAYSQVHTHAVYIHAGETYFVDRLDTERNIAFVSKKDLDYYTQAIDDDNLVIDSEDQSKRWRRVTVATGPVRVITNWLMFKKVKFQTRESIGFEGLDLPSYTLETTALWFPATTSAAQLCQQYGRAVSEGLIGVANLFTEVMPLFVMCDPSDVGAVVDSTNLQKPAIFIYDRYEGGIGFAEKAYELLEEIVQAVRRIIHECPCRTGCPSCVGAAITPASATETDAGVRDRIPDKEAALIILHDLLELAPYVPKEVLTPRPATAPEQQPTRSIKAVPLPKHLEGKIRRRVQKYRERGRD